MTVQSQGTCLLPQLVSSSFSRRPICQSHCTLSVFVLQASEESTFIERLQDLTQYLSIHFKSRKMYLSAQMLLPEPECKWQPQQEISLWREHHSIIRRIKDYR